MSATVQSKAMTSPIPALPPIRLRPLALAGALLLSLAALGEATDPYSFGVSDFFGGYAGDDTSQIELAADSRGTLYAASLDRTADGSHPVRASRSLDGGRTWSTTTVLNDPSGSSFAANVQVCCDDLGHAYVTWVDGYYTVDLATTQDHGETWSVPHPATNNFDSVRQYPVLSCDNAGRLVVLWEEDDVTYGPQVFVRASQDYGASWATDPINLLPEPNRSGVETQAATNGRGDFYAVWNDLDTTIGSRVAFKSSHDGGLSWSVEPMFLVATNEDAGGLPVLTADAAGRVYVAWCATFTGSSPVWAAFAGSTDFGQSFAIGPKVISGPDFSAIDEDIAADDAGNVYVSFEAYDQTGPYIHFNVSHDGGQTWLPQELRIDHSPADTIQPRLAAGKDGHVYIAWHDYRKSNTLFMNYSTDAGGSFQPQDLEVTDARRATTSFAFPSMVTDDRGFLYIAWAEDAAPGAHFNLGSPALSMGLVPPTGPSLVPAGGGTIPADASLLNTTSARLSGLSIWIDATLQSGKTTKPRQGPITLSLAAGKGRARSINVRVPGKLPPGLYQVNLRATGPICDQATLPILKLP